MNPFDIRKFVWSLPDEYFFAFIRWWRRDPDEAAFYAIQYMMRP